VGNIILMGSLSHLGHFGLDSYAADLVKTLSVVKALVGGLALYCTYRSCWGGGWGWTTERVLFDLDSWLPGTCPNPGVQLGSVQLVFWDVVAAVGVSGRRAACGGTR
jgi:hypothetical protein